MKKTTFTLLLSFSCCWMAAQCPTGDVTFSTQGQIDSFPILYPDCQNLPGNVAISGKDIVGLDSLYSLKFIGGSLLIFENDTLASLGGLNNLHFVGEYVTINDNRALPSLVGLQNLKSAGVLLIVNNDSLGSLKGLNALQYIKGGVFIQENDALKSLSGLENIDTIRGQVEIADNGILPSLFGLHNLEAILPSPNTGTGLSITSNDSLSSLMDLAKLRHVESIQISFNPHLSTLAGLEHIDSVGSLSISHNYALVSLSGLENLTCIWEDGVPTINIIAGNYALTSLDGLANLQRIDGSFQISVNDRLTSLNGLNNLQDINGSLIVRDNDSLVSLTGLDNLRRVGRFLIVDKNDALASFNGLDNLDTIRKQLLVDKNTALTSLSALQNMQYIGDSNSPLQISNNPKLGTCNIPPVCHYLENNGLASIYSNAPGCNSVEEVEAACMVSTLETSTGNLPLQISPNPTTNFLQINTEDTETWPLSIHDLSGKMRYQGACSRSQTISLHDWPAGLYTLRAVSGGQVFVGKVVKQ